jgi:hypothetical protein
MRFVSIVLASVALSVSCQAWAAGGAHIVDDSEPEAPGQCHFEFWASTAFNADRAIDAAPACASPKIPWLEIGAAFNHYWGSWDAPLFGPAIKANLQPETSGLGLGIGFNSSVNLRTGDLGLATALLLMSAPITEKVGLNVNTGWSYAANADSSNAFFYGAQVEIDIAPDLMFMVEAFGRAPGFAGTQAGLRFTPNKGPIDFDLLFGHYFDSFTTRIVTVGVIARF